MRCYCGRVPGRWAVSRIPSGHVGASVERRDGGTRSRTRAETRSRQPASSCCLAYSAVGLAAASTTATVKALAMIDMGRRLASNASVRFKVSEPLEGRTFCLDGRGFRRWLADRLFGPLCADVRAGSGARHTHTSVLGRLSLPQQRLRGLPNSHSPRSGTGSP